jgi:DnaJ family protein B protein 12
VVVDHLEDLVEVVSCVQFKSWKGVLTFSFLGPGFVFNMGGGPGVRVHQFGGAAPRRRPRDPNAPPEPAPSATSVFMGLLPLLIFFVGLPILSNLLGGDSGSSGPQMRFDHAQPPQTMSRHSKNYQKEYWINPTEVETYNARTFSTLDANADVMYVQELRYKCTLEQDQKQNMINDAQGWFFPDMAKMQKASQLPLVNCKKLGDLGQRRH